MLDAGVISQQGSPYELLKNKGGLFYKYVAETGDKTLWDVCKTPYETIPPQVDVDNGTYRSDRENISLFGEYVNVALNDEDTYI